MDHRHCPPSALKRFNFNLIYSVLKVAHYLSENFTAIICRVVPGIYPEIPPPPPVLCIYKVVKTA